VNFKEVAACIDFMGFEIPVPEKPVNNNTNTIPNLKYGILV
jgi:hypothetical protein